MCGSALSKGYLGERGWIRWYKKKPEKSVNIFSLGEKLLKFNFWGRWSGVTNAKRCLNCNIILFKAEIKSNIRKS